MATISISSNEIIAFLLVFFRVGAILSTAPLFGNRSIPARVRVLLSFTLAIVVVMPLRASGGLAGEAIGSLQYQGVAGLFLAILREVILGVAIGFTASLAFSGIQLAGEFVGYEMGFAMMKMLDPTTRVNVTVTSQLYVATAMLIFVLVRGHHYILMCIAESLTKMPPGEWEPSASLVGHVSSVFSGIFSTGLRIAIPVMGALFLAKMSLAIVARTMPQMNVFIVGFPVQIAVGLMAMAISLPFFVKVLCALFSSMRENIFAIVGG